MMKTMLFVYFLLSATAVAGTVSLVPDYTTLSTQRLVTVTMPLSSLPGPISRKSSRSSTIGSATTRGSTAHTTTPGTVWPRPSLILPSTGSLGATNTFKTTCTSQLQRPAATSNSELLPPIWLNPPFTTTYPNLESFPTIRPDPTTTTYTNLESFPTIRPDPTTTTYTDLESFPTIRPAPTTTTTTTCTKMESSPTIRPDPTTTTKSTKLNTSMTKIRPGDPKTRSTRWLTPTPSRIDPETPIPSLIFPETPTPSLIFPDISNSSRSNTVTPTSSRINTRNPASIVSDCVTTRTTSAASYNTYTTKSFTNLGGWASFETAPRLVRSASKSPEAH